MYMYFSIIMTVFVCLVYFVETFVCKSEFFRHISAQRQTVSPEKVSIQIVNLTKSSVSKE